MTQVMNINIDLIDTAPQVRTKFNEASIAELAADIKAHGVLQPLVVQQRGGRFVLLIGERRLRAIRYLGDVTVPAIVATVSADMANEVQLIENIQREDLNAKDLSAAIKTLWEKHGSVADVARRCHKSPSWVSKRLALALDVGTATAALIDGNVKDVELIYYFKKLEKLDAKKAAELMPAVLAGECGREEVKAAIFEDERPALPSPSPAKKESENLDLFADGTDTGEAKQDVIIEQLRIAMAALTEISAAKVGSPQSLKMRKLASDAVEQINAIALAV